MLLCRDFLAQRDCRGGRIRASLETDLGTAKKAEKEDIMRKVLVAIVAAALATLGSQAMAAGSASGMPPKSQACEKSPNPPKRCDPAPPPATDHPTVVSIASPVTDSSVSGQFVLSGSASDEDGIASISWRVIGYEDELGFHAEPGYVEGSLPWQFCTGFESFTCGPIDVSELLDGVRVAVEVGVSDANKTGTTLRWTGYVDNPEPDPNAGATGTIETLYVRTTSAGTGLCHVGGDCTLVQSSVTVRSFFSVPNVDHVTVTICIDGRGCVDRTTADGQYVATDAFSPHLHNRDTFSGTVTLHWFGTEDHVLDVRSFSKVVRDDCVYAEGGGSGPGYDCYGLGAGILPA